MKVLVVTHSFPPEIGGIEQVAWEQARGLAERGHEVRVVTAFRGRGAAREAREGVAITRFPCKEPLRWLGIPYVLPAHRMKAAVRKQTRWSDVVVAHGHPYLSTRWAAQAAESEGNPFYLVQHNSFIHYPFPLEWLERLNDATLGRYSLGTAKKVVCVSRETERYVKSVCPEAETTVLYNGVDTKRFSPTRDKAALRKKMGLPVDGFNVFTARRLAYKNGIDLLLEAARRLKNEKEISFRVAGTGPDERKIREAIKASGLNRVRLLGFVEEDALPDYYRVADAFVLPSRSGEGFPLAVLEALASGLPVVATRSGGQAEVIVDGKNGFLADVSGKALAEKIAWLAGNRVPCERLAAAARKSVEGMDWLENVKKLETVLAGDGTRQPGEG